MLSELLRTFLVELRRRFILYDMNTEYTNPNILIKDSSE